MPNLSSVSKITRVQLESVAAPVNAAQSSQDTRRHLSDNLERLRGEMRDMPASTFRPEQRPPSFDVARQGSYKTAWFQLKNSGVDGLIQASRLGKAGAALTGDQLRLSVDPQKMHKAFEVLAPLLMSEDSPFDSWQIADTTCRRPGGQGYHGAQIVLDARPEGADGHYAASQLKRIGEFVNRLDDELFLTGMDSGERPATDASAPNWCYASYRNAERDNCTGGAARHQDAPFFHLVSNPDGDPPAAMAPGTPAQRGKPVAGAAQARAKFQDFAKESLEQSLRGLQARRAFQQDVQAIARHFPPVSQEQRLDWQLSGSDEADSTILAEDAKSGAQKTILARGNIEEALRDYRDAMENVHRSYHQRFGNLAADSPISELKAAAAMAHAVKRLSDDMVFDYAQAVVYERAQEYFRANKATVSGPAASPDEVTAYWRGVLHKSSQARVFDTLDLDAEFIRSLSSPDLQRIALSTGRPGTFGAFTALLQDRTDADRQSMRTQYAAWRKQLGAGGKSDRRAGEVMVKQGYDLRAIGLGAGYCAAYSALFTMAWMKHGPESIGKLFGGIQQGVARHLAVTVPNQDMKAFRNMVERLYRAPEVNSAYSGAPIALDEIFDDLAQEAGPAAYAINTRKHAMALATRVDSAGQRHYNFFDPNFGSVDYTERAAAEQALGQYFQARQRAYGVDIDNETVLLDVMKPDTGAMERLSALDLSDPANGVSGKLGGFIEDMAAGRKAPLAGARDIRGGDVKMGRAVPYS